MTYFGKNIRKIRSIQKMSQSNLAEIFGLSRASIGSYEEGRAEPKLDIIIKIAKHFSITVDDLVNKEITVNELYHFNIFDENLNSEISIGSEILKKMEFQPVPLVTSHDIVVHSIPVARNNAQNKLTIPGLSEEKHLAVLVDEVSFKYCPLEVKKDDIIVIDVQFTVDDSTDISGINWLFKSGKMLFLGELKKMGRNGYIYFPYNASPIAFSEDDIDFMFPFQVHIENNPKVCQGAYDKLHKLERQVNDLYNRI